MTAPPLAPAPAPPSTLGELLAYAFLPGSTWLPRLYGQVRDPLTGAGSASIGPPLDLTSTTTVEDVESELVRRQGGPVDVLVRLRVAGAIGVGQPGWTKDVRVEVASSGARAYLGNAGVVPPAAGPAVSEVAALRSELTRMAAALDEARKPSTTSVVASDPFSIAVQLQKMQTEATKSALDAFRAVAPPPPTATTPTDHSFWLGLGERLASKSSGGIDWVALAGGLGPVLLRFADAAGTVAEARRLEAEALLAQSRRLLAVAPAPASPAPAPASAPVDAPAAWTGAAVSVPE